MTSYTTTYVRDVVRLTSLQHGVLRFMHDFFLANQQLPPVERISWHFGWASNNNTHEHLARLTTKGYLTKNVVGKNKFTALALDMLTAKAEA